MEHVYNIMSQYPRIVKYNIELQEGYNLLVANVNEAIPCVACFGNNFYYILKDKDQGYIVIKNYNSNNEVRATNNDLYVAIMEVEDKAKGV